MVIQQMHHVLQLDNQILVQLLHLYFKILDIRENQSSFSFIFQSLLKNDTHLNHEFIYSLYIMFIIQIILILDIKYMFISKLES